MAVDYSSVQVSSFYYRLLFYYETVNSKLQAFFCLEQPLSIDWLV